MPNQPNTPEYNAYWSGGQNPNAPLVVYYPDTVPSTNAAVRGGIIDIDTVNENAYISIKPGVWAYIGGTSSLPEIKTVTGDSGGAVGPTAAGNLNILGTAGQITVTGNPVTNTLTLALTGGGTAIDSITVDASTAPGTNPVTPNGSGLIAITGAQVSSGTVGANVIRTDSLAANSITIEIQRSTAVSATDSTKNGVSHFDSGAFSVDSSGFVTLKGGTEAIDSFIPDSGTSPVVPAANGSVTMAGSGSITTVGGTNTLTTQLTGLTNHALLVGAGTSTITKVGPSATTGAPVISGGAAADPGFSTTVVINDATETLTLSAGANTIQPQIICRNTWNTAGGGQAANVVADAHSSASQSDVGYFSSGQWDTPKYWNFGMTSTASSYANAFNINYAAGTPAPEGGTVCLSVATAGGVTVPAGNLDVVRSENGAAVAIQSGNTSNTAASGAALISTVTGTSGGDAYTQWTITNAPNSYSMGIDNSDSDKLKINYNASTSVNPSQGSELLTISSAGLVTVPLNDLSVSRSRVGGNVALGLSNTDNTSAASAAVFTTAVGGTSGGSPMHVFNIPSGSDWTIGADNGQSDRFSIAQATAALNTNPVFLATTAGEVTMPLQPAFFAYLASTATDKTGNGASYTLGTDALTEVYDQNGDFNTNGTFTAPVNGIYDLRAQVAVSGCTIATNFQITIVVSGTNARSYQNTFSRAASSLNQYVSVSTLARMTAGDTAVVTILSTGEAANTDDITGASDAVTYFCGTLAC